MHIDIITVFPEIIESYTSVSILKRAREKGLASVDAVNLRDFSSNKFRHVDDTPYGGGAGMVLACDPCFKAIEHCIDRAGENKPRIVFTSPAGRKFDQEYAEELSMEKNLIILCGRYEGFDQRIADTFATDEISIGDYVICGGELASLVISEAVIRLIPEVLGNDASCEDESFSEGLLEYPQYTKPEIFRGLGVPRVLLEGNHKKINEWRRHRQLEITLKKRPDIIDERLLSDSDLEYLKKIKSEGENNE